MSKLSTHPGVVVGADGSPGSKVAVESAARDTELRNVPLTLGACCSGDSGDMAGIVIGPGVDGWATKTRRQVMDVQVSLTTAPERAETMPMKAPTRPGTAIVTQTMNPALGEQLAAAHELVGRGCAQVVVSLGSKGALVATPTASQHYSPATAPPGSGVGAGDVMVAGITVGFSRGGQLDKAVRLGIAAGAAMLLTPGAAPCTRADVERFFEMVANPIHIDAPRRNDGKPRPADQPLCAQARTSP